MTRLLNSPFATGSRSHVRNSPDARRARLRIREIGVRNASATATPRTTLQEDLPEPDRDPNAEPERHTPYPVHPTHDPARRDPGTIPRDPQPNPPVTEPQPAPFDPKATEM